MLRALSTPKLVISAMHTQATPSNFVDKVALIGNLWIYGAWAFWKISRPTEHGGLVTTFAHTDLVFVLRLIQHFKKPRIPCTIKMLLLFLCRWSSRQPKKQTLLRPRKPANWNFCQVSFVNGRCFEPCETVAVRRAILLLPLTSKKLLLFFLSREQSITKILKKF